MKATVRNDGTPVTVTLGASVLALAFALGAGSFSARAQQLVDADLSVATVVSGLQQPTAFVFLPAAPDAPLDLLVCEKSTGHVIRVVNGVIRGVVLDLPVNSVSERGLLGIALHPNHASNGFVYLYYTQSSTGGDSNIRGEVEAHLVERYTWTGSALESPRRIQTLPVTPGPNHDGGVILFGPDDKLYGVIGDLNRNGQLQNFPSGALPDDTSIIFRVNDDGSAPPDNPFFASPGNMSSVFAYGIRNSFGLDFDPLTGDLWQTENGPDRMDEINRVPAGFNSGWAPLMGPDSEDPDSVADLWDAGGSTYADPLFSWRTPIGVTSIHFVRGDVLGPTYAHRILVGDVNSRDLYCFELNPERTDLVLPTPGTSDRVADSSQERDVFLFGTGFGPVTDIDSGRDGVYVCSLTGSIYRIHSTVTALEAETWGGLKRRYRASSGRK